MTLRSFYEPLEIQFRLNYAKGKQSLITLLTTQNLRAKLEVQATYLLISYIYKLLFTQPSKQFTRAKKNSS